ncbi:MAG TPA: TadE family type IV pilus minor pilin [Dermatophilaceae bacterium]|nr:TadE family type IV pilus minor pilin [Dermatophilaceae bacterium]
MVTAELALALPAVVVVLATAITVFLAAAAQLRCLDAAAAAARAAARCDSRSAVLEVARRGAPVGSEVQLTADRAVAVTVTAPSPALGRWLPGSLRPSATVVASLESGSCARA